MTSTESEKTVGTGAASPVYLAAENVHKAFGGSKALDGVQLELRKGEVHALVGANGAGKSTLARIIAGHLRPDRADISITGRPVHILSPRDAISLGVAMVTQQLSLAADLTVAENIMLTEFAKPGFYNRRRLYETADAMLKSVNPAGGIDLSSPAGRLSSAHRQMVEIAKAMCQNPAVIILDEPTTSLTPFETERLFDVMEHLTRQGKALVFVSHRMEEVFTICNVVTVLRDGRNVCASQPIASLDQAGLIKLIIGRDLGNDIYGGRVGADTHIAERSGTKNVTPEIVLEVRRLKAPPAVEDVSFDLRKGEVLGLAGLVGAGRTETARILFGLDKMQSGEIIVRGMSRRRHSPRHSYRSGMAMIPEDRKTQGLIPDFTVRENIMLGHSATFSRFGTGYSRLMSTVFDIIKELNLGAEHLQKFILELSGGMQQKAMLGRALLVNPEILILDEPTQGVDVGTRSDIYAILRRLAGQGLSIVFISSDFEEILGISDRIVVLSEGRSVAEFDAGLMDEEKLTMFAAPRTSARSTYRLLQSLIEQWPGACAFWVYFGHGRVYCFDSLDGGAGLGTGFGAGEVVFQKSTCLAPFGLESDSAVVGESADGSPKIIDGLASMLIPRYNARGQRLGYIGLAMPAGEADPLYSREFVKIVTEWT